MRFPQSISSIGFCGFYLCRSLSAIELSENVSSIGQAAFANTGLKSLFIPKYVNDISFSIVGSCNNLVSLSVDPENFYYDSRGGCNAVIKKNDNTLVSGCRYSVIPEGVTNLGLSCLNDPGIESLVLPSTLTSVNYSFDCNNLKSIVSKAVVPPTITSGLGKFNPSNAIVLKVPVGTRGTYINAGWTEDIFKGGVVEDTSLYDVNGDESVTITDVMKVVNVVLGFPQQ